MTTRSLAPLSLWLLAGLGFVFLAGTQGCDDARAVSPEFLASGLRSGDEAIYHNEPVVIRFTRALARMAPPEDALDLRDAEGRRVQCKLTVRGRFLALEPRSSGGWPQTSHLVARLLWPPPGLPIRSADGAPLSSGFEHVVNLRPGHRRGNGPLLLTAAVRRDLLTTPRPGQSPTRESRLEFNAPLDPASLADGFRVSRVRDGRPVPPADWYVRLSQHDARVVFVGFLRGLSDRRGVHAFHPQQNAREEGEDYEVSMTSSLRSLDGRTPSSQTPLLRLRTPANAFGYITFDFNELTDFASESSWAYRPDSPLRPRKNIPQPVQIPHPSLEVADSSVPVFGSQPTRTYVRIPARFLPGSGLQAFYIQALWLYPDDGTDVDAEVSGFEATLSYLVAGGALSEVFKECEGALRPPEDRAAHFDSRTLLFEHPDGAPPVLRIPLEQPSPDGRGRDLPAPFFYDGRGLDLVMRISTTGVTSPRGQQRISLHTFSPTDSADNHLVVGLEGRGVGTAGAPLPKMVLLTYTYRPVTTRWYGLRDLQDLEFSRTRDLDFRGKGFEGRDFEVRYQGGRTLPEGGHEATTTWLRQPPRGGCNAVRLKITPIPKPRGAEQEELEIDSLTLHFQVGKKD